MTLWVRFERAGAVGFGTLEGEIIQVHVGDMLANPTRTGETADAASVRLLAPVVPSKMVCLWNNFHAAAEKQGNSIPPEPLYFIKAPSAYADPGAAIKVPRFYDGRIIYEGELGIVIGKRLSGASEEEAAAGIFGYTCVNDVTALDLLSRDQSFAQWTRAKSFDGFGPMGPAIATGLDPATLNVRTLVNDRERQNYPVADMIFPPARLTSLISRDMTLEPGDVISCGTSLGAGPWRPGAKVEIIIDGIGTLSTWLESAAA